MRRSCLLVVAWLALVIGGSGAGAGSRIDRVDALPSALAEGVEALRSGDLDRSEAAFRSVLEAQSGNVAARLGLAQVAETRGDAAGAMRWIREATDLEATPTVLAFSVALATRIGRSGDALELLTKLREVAPLDPTGYVGAALLLRDLERADEAIELLDQALDRGVGDGVVERELGLLELARGNASRGRELGLRAWGRGERSRDVAALVGLSSAELGWSPESQGETDDGASSGFVSWDAVRWLRVALGAEAGVGPGGPVAGLPELPGREATVRLALAALLVERDRLEEALAELDGVIELDPRSAEAHYQRALVLEALGRATESTTALTRFQELTTAAGEAENAARELGVALNEAQDLANRNELEASLAKLETLVAEHPDFAPIRALHGKVLFSMARREEAFDAIVRARELDPARTEYHYLEAFFGAHLERWDAAEAAAERALALEPDLEEARGILAEIRRLRSVEAAP